MTEDMLYQKSIKPFLNKLGFFFYRVEHARLPDIYTSKNGNVLWIELKVINRLCREEISPDWRPGQLAWIKEHFKLGGDLTALCLWYKDNIYFLPPKKTYELSELKKGDYYGYFAKRQIRTT